MSKIIFRNPNMKAIKEILKKIGKDDYDQALRKVGLNEQPPLSMNGFYLEFDVDTKEIDICYQYSGGSRHKIISALGYWEIPNEGWVMHWNLEGVKMLR